MDCTVGEVRFSVVSGILVPQFFYPCRAVSRQEVLVSEVATDVDNSDHNALAPWEFPVQVVGPGLYLAYGCLQLV
jgi:hypothetical protein